MPAGSWRLSKWREGSEHSSGVKLLASGKGPAISRGDFRMFRLAPELTALVLSCADCEEVAEDLLRVFYRTDYLESNKDRCPPIPNQNTPGTPPLPGMET